MKKIDISTKKHPNTFALVDDEDFDRINNMGKWSAALRGSGKGLHARLSKKRGYCSMHRVIMNAPDGMEVDHIFHNTLDNRKSKLRLCTRAENAKNQLPKGTGGTNFKGVDRRRGNNGWRATITSDKKIVKLGYFDTAEDAAAAYNVAALELHGEFACLNEINFLLPRFISRSKSMQSGANDLDPPYLMGLGDGVLLPMLKKLTYREREVVSLRYGIDNKAIFTLEEVGKIFKVTRERARQVEVKALRKLKEMIEIQPDFIL